MITRHLGKVREGLSTCQMSMFFPIYSAEACLVASAVVCVYCIYWRVGNDGFEVTGPL
eukprot:c402_g1_i1 orf=27-200(-)